MIHLKLLAAGMIAISSICNAIAQDIPMPVQREAPPHRQAPRPHSPPEAVEPTTQHEYARELVTPRPRRPVLPSGTMLQVTPLQEITSKRIEEGDQVAFVTVNDVSEDGYIAIQRGTPVTGLITWKTGRAIGGKSGKFEVDFKSISIGGRQYALRGQHRQEGRGNTIGALFGAIVISGRSASMLPGQLVNIFTAEPIVY